MKRDTRMTTNAALVPYAVGYPQRAARPVPGAASARCGQCPVRPVPDAASAERLGRRRACHDDATEIARPTDHPETKGLTRRDVAAAPGCHSASPPSSPHAIASLCLPVAGRNRQTDKRTNEKNKNGTTTCVPRHHRALARRRRHCDLAAPRHVATTITDATTTATIATTAISANAATASVADERTGGGGEGRSKGKDSQPSGPSITTHITIPAPLSLEVARGSPRPHPPHQGTPPQSWHHDWSGGRASQEPARRRRSSSCSWVDVPKSTHHHPALPEKALSTHHAPH